MNKERIFLSPPHMSGEELRYVKEAFDSNYIAPLGPMVDAFEKEFSEYVGISNCLALSSGTAAMHLALHHLGVGPGDEVLASSLTFIGSVSPVRFLGADPVFIDADPATWNMDLSLLANELESSEKRGKLPKAVIPTDLYGQCVDMDEIRSICDSYGVPVLADSAEAMGAVYKNSHAGVGASASVYSFNGNKIITTSGGGMLASDDSDLIEHARYLSTQARDNTPHYEHSEIGYNYRMSNILAAVGRGQLSVIDDRVSARRKINAQYKELLTSVPGIQFMPETVYGEANCWLTVVLIDPDEFGQDHESVRQALETENIEARPLWKPMHLQPVFKEARACGGAVSEGLFSKGLCLPSGSALTDVDLVRITDIIRKTSD